MCPFDDLLPIGELRSQARKLWHHHQDLLAQYEALGQRTTHEAAELQARLDENARLQERIAQLLAQQEETNALKTRVAELEAKLKDKSTKRKGNHSERRKKPACTAEACVDPACATHAKPERPKQKGHGPREQATLPCDEKIHALPDDERMCSTCGNQLKEWEGQTEVCEMIEIHVRGYVRRKHILLKYVCSCKEGIKTAPGPLKLIPGGRYSIAFAVEVAYGKYCDHLPLERQVRTMNHEGLDIDSQTLWDQIDYLSFLLRGAYDRVRQYIFEHEEIGADETTWRLMPNEGGSKTWLIWLCQVQDAAWYTLQPTRGENAARVLFNLESENQSLADALSPPYQGVVMVDGYAVYKTLSVAYPALLLAHCWSHVRREVLDAQKGFPAQSLELLNWIDELFAIDKQAPLGRVGDEKRAALRAKQSTAVLTKIEAWVWAYGQSVPPGSSLAKAAGYLANQWVGRSRFVHNPRIPLHNNASETAARTPVIGRKNHDGSRSERGTKVAAILYTLVETARRSRMDPKSYLHLCAVRNLRKLSPVLPNEVTEAMLIEQLDMTADKAHRALRWHPDDEENSEVGDGRASATVAKAEETRVG